MLVQDALHLFLFIFPLLSSVSATKSNGHFQIDFEAKRSSVTSYSKNKYKSLKKRSLDYAEFSLDNEDTQYMANITLGTPGQNMAVLLDTGSADMWVMSKDNSYCTSEVDCTLYGTFDVESSTSYKYNNSDFNIKYADNTIAQGDWGWDTLTIGDELTIDDFYFAIGNISNSTVPVLGIGFEELETTALSQYTINPYKYRNLPAALVSSGIINSRAYSLYLNGVDASSGSILFGAVDHAKYVGNLETVQIITGSSSTTKPIKLQITLSSLNTTINGTTSSHITEKIPALLDSGTTLTYVPETYVASLGKAVGGTYSSSVGAYTLDCVNSSNTNYLHFNFTGATVSVPLRNFLLTVTHKDGSAAKSDDGNDLCALGILSSSSSSIILGDSFLRNAYVVYDLDNYEISLATAQLNQTSSSIATISSGSNGVPGATQASAYDDIYSVTLSSGKNADSSLSDDDTNSTSTGSSKAASTSTSMGSALYLPNTLVVLSALFFTYIFCFF